MRSLKVIVGLCVRDLHTKFQIDPMSSLGDKCTKAIFQAFLDYKCQKVPEGVKLPQKLD